MAKPEPIDLDNIPHTHHWCLASPDGPESLGKCYCGEERMFKNSNPHEGTDTWSGNTRHRLRVQTLKNTKRTKKNS